MLMQNFGVTNKEHYAMLWYFLELSIRHSVIMQTKFIVWSPPRRPWSLKGLWFLISIAYIFSIACILLRQLDMYRTNNRL